MHHSTEGNRQPRGFTGAGSSAPQGHKAPVLRTVSALRPGSRAGLVAGLCNLGQVIVAKPPFPPL